jgi:GTPase
MSRYLAAGSRDFLQPTTSAASPRRSASSSWKRRAVGTGPRDETVPHEIERREVRDRISQLQQELKAVHREQVERRRHREGLPNVAIVGYTNAGKSSLMRALTSSEVLVVDQLFATLDTTVRALQPETHPRILVSDTVGFIRNLPHDLVASFRSTLDEALDSSLLLHVVDAADPALRSHIQVTKEVLEGIGAGKLQSLLILNKVDAVDISQKALRARRYPQEYPRAQRILRGKGCSSQDKGEPRHRYRLEATARFVRTPSYPRPLAWFW